jgi:hypothetical protein
MFFIFLWLMTFLMKKIKPFVLFHGQKSRKETEGNKKSMGLSVPFFLLQGGHSSFLLKQLSKQMHPMDHPPPSFFFKSNMHLK